MHSNIKKTDMDLDALPKKAGAEVKTDTKKEYVMDIAQMIRMVDNEPKRRMIYSGIKEKSFGIVFGSSKSGKSTYAENLAFSIAAGFDSYLGKPIDIDNRTVLIFGLEEHYSPRTERNKKQLEALTPALDADWLSNIHVMTDAMPRYIDSEEDWSILNDVIKSVSPGLVIIDSLTHLYTGGIEDSEIAKKLMKHLRELCEQTGTTIIGIHHTHKLYDKGLSLHTIAGSRIIAQETDFMIGLNRTSNGCHYIKDVAFRYIQADSEKVTTFSIDQNAWIQSLGETTEDRILSALDGRFDDGNRGLIMEYFEDNDGEVTAGTLISEFVTDNIMSRQTLFTSLRMLVNDNHLSRISKGVYKKAA